MASFPCRTQARDIPSEPISNCLSSEPYLKNRCTSPLSAMRHVFNHFTDSKKGPKDRSHIGALFFDEVKIKEGLVWDCKTNEIIGFVELDQNEENEELPDQLATHILQFSFKSLFSKFTHPCAYFLTRNITYGQIDKLFWKGVNSLDEYGFQVLMVCCDGASANRKFMEMNMKSNNEPIVVNPLTHKPIFFMSDPTHLIKKLRNNLLKSGRHPACKRLLKFKGELLLWKHMRDVYDRDTRRQLRYTPLRKDHLELTSLSLMRSKLAFDVFNQTVEDDIKKYSPDGTTSIRLFLSAVRSMITIFTSHDKVSGKCHKFVGDLQKVLVFFKEWKDYADSLPCKQERAKSFLSYQVYQDLRITLNGFISLLDYMENDPQMQHMKLYVQPYRLNQDFLENYFGIQRSSGGCAQNMTAHRYGYQALAIQQTHVIPGNLGNAAVNMPLTPTRK